MKIHSPFTFHPNPSIKKFLKSPCQREYLLIKYTILNQIKLSFITIKSIVIS